MHPVALALAALFALGCTQNVTALESVDAAIDAVTVPDGGIIANICDQPELFDGMMVEMSVTGIQQTTRRCTGECDAGYCCTVGCQAYWVVPCAGGGQLTFSQDDGGFGCFGNMCDPNCRPSLVPSDVLTFTAVVHVGGRQGYCCPEVFGVDAIATFDVSTYTVTSLPDS